MEGNGNEQDITGNVENTNEVDAREGVDGGWDTVEEGGGDEKEDGRGGWVASASEGEVHRGGAPAAFPQLIPLIPHARMTLRGDDQEEHIGVHVCEDVGRTAEGGEGGEKRKEGGMGGGLERGASKDMGCGVEEDVTMSIACDVFVGGRAEEGTAGGGGERHRGDGDVDVGVVGYVRVVDVADVDAADVRDVHVGDVRDVHVEDVEHVHVGDVSGDIGWTDPAASPAAGEGERGTVGKDRCDDRCGHNDAQSLHLEEEWRLFLDGGKDESVFGGGGGGGLLKEGRGGGGG